MTTKSRHYRCGPRIPFPSPNAVVLLDRRGVAEQGTALGFRARGLTGPRVVTLLGDAELDEGSNHEAIAYARAIGLDTLTAVVIDNASATHGWSGGIATRFEREGWSTVTVDGRDHDALEAAFTAPHPGAVRAR